MVQERLRFSAYDDLVLLREVFTENPYNDSTLWKKVQSATISLTGKSFSMRTIKEHMQLLLKAWEEKGTAGVRKSESDKLWAEKEHLLTSIYEQVGPLKGKRQFVKDSVTCDEGESFVDQEVELKNETLTDMYLTQSDTEEEHPVRFLITNITSANDNTEPITSLSNKDLLNTQTCASPHNFSSSELNQGKRKHIEHITKNNNETNNDLKRRQLEVEEKKILLEQKKFELEERKLRLEERKWKQEELEREKRMNIEINERQQRLCLEIEERRHHLKQLEQQQKIMELMLQVISKK